MLQIIAALPGEGIISIGIAIGINIILECLINTLGNRCIAVIVDVLHKYLNDVDVVPLICPSRLTIIRNSKMTALIGITFPIAIRFRNGCRTTLVIFFRTCPVLVAASLTFPGTLLVKSSVET
jgi:hypothetical protein